MSKAQEFGEWLGGAIQKYPQRAKLAASAIFLLIMSLPAYFMWRDLSEGRVLHVLIGVGIASYGAWKAYSKAKQGAHR